MVLLGGLGQGIRTLIPRILLGLQSLEKLVVELGDGVGRGGHIHKRLILVRHIVVEQRLLRLLARAGRDGRDEEDLLFLGNLVGLLLTGLFL